MALSAFGFSTMAIFVKRLAPSLPQFELVFFRSLINLIVVSFFVFRGSHRIWVSERPLLLFRGLMGFLGVSCLFYSLSHLPLPVAMMLSWCSPVFVMIFSFIFLKERLPHRAGLWLLLAAASLGLLLKVDLKSFSMGLSPLAAAIGILGAASGGLAYVAVRAATARVGVHVIVFYFVAVSSILSLPLALHQFVTPRPEQWLDLLALGGFAALGQFAMTQGYGYAAAGIVSTMSLLNPVFAGVWGILFFNETLGPGQWFGMGGIGSAVVGLTWLSHRKDATAGNLLYK